MAKEIELEQKENGVPAIEAAHIPSATETREVDRELIESYEKFMSDVIARVEADQAEQRAWREQHRPAFEEAARRGEWAPDWVRGPMEQREKAEAFTQQYGNHVGEFLQRERAQIAEFQSVASQVDAPDVPLYEAYLNGRRDSYNGLRDQLAASNPNVNLPAAIELDEIRVQQQVVWQEEKQDQSLSVAR